MAKEKEGKWRTRKRGKTWVWKEVAKKREGKQRTRKRGKTGVEGSGKGKRGKRELGGKTEE